MGPGVLSMKIDDLSSVSRLTPQASASDVVRVDMREGAKNVVAYLNNVEKDASYEE